MITLRYAAIGRIRIPKTRGVCGMIEVLISRAMVLFRFHWTELFDLCLFS